jgi:hypothetical protein
MFDDATGYFVVAITLVCLIYKGLSVRVTGIFRCVSSSALDRKKKPGIAARGSLPEFGLPRHAASYPCKGSRSFCAAAERRFWGHDRRGKEQAADAHRSAAGHTSVNIDALRASSSLFSTAKASSQSGRLA